MNINDNFKYLHIGLPDDVLRLKFYGDFEGAIAAIDRHLEKQDIPDALKKCLTAQREIIVRLPKDYPYTREQALSILCKHIPGFSEAEFDALKAAWKLDWIYDHGVEHYFGRFFETLCKTDAAFAERAGIKAAVSEQAKKRAAMFYNAAEKLRKNGEISVRIQCRASLRLNDSAFHRGIRVRAYLPLPCACEDQSDIRIERVCPEPTHLSPETAPQRVVFWEKAMQENHEFSVEFSYVRTARYADLSGIVASADQPSFDTEEIPPHIVFTPYIRELAKLLTKGVTNPLEKARRFYDFITLNVKYSFMRAYFGLENIAEACARNLTGDCGVQTLLFITLCRCIGIPARWQSGWEAETGFCGAHDWAQFYVAPYGWLYADPSFGGNGAPEAKRQHYFGNLDPYRMAANTQFQADFDVPKAYWRADPYDNQLGEMETEDRGLCYDEFERTKEVLKVTEL